MSRITLWFTVVLAATLALLVSMLNAHVVELELAFARIQTPLGLALVLVFVAGLVLGMIWRVTWVAELLSERGRLRQALRVAEARARAAAAGKDAG